jgi:four helix bundle protein
VPFHRLNAYRKAYELSLAIHRESLGFPRFEQYELASQLRRSTKSICANMAEGLGRQTSPKEVVKFLRMSLGSCDETRVWLEYARDLKYLDTSAFERLYDGYCEVGRMLNGLISSWSRRSGRREFV